MRLAVLGGTGVVGAPLLGQALDQGHHVRLLARDPRSVTPHERLEVVEGNALQADDVAKTVIGSDAALSTLGGYGDSDALRYGVPHVVEAMRAHGVHRLVVLQGFHLDLPGDPGGIGRSLVGMFLRLADRDLVGNSQAMADQLLTVRDIDWTLVRIPRVVPGGPTGQVSSGLLRLGPWSKVTAGDAAAAMITSLGDTATVHQAPMVRSI